MSLVVYVYSKCSTCQKALRFLEANQVAFEKKEIKETPPSLTELQAMLKYVKGDVKKLFNTSGLVYRELKLSEKLPTLSLDAALQLLSQDGMLVKRPFVLGDNKGLVGFHEAKWQSELC